MDASNLSLKVVNLNCWGVFVPFATVKRHERLDAICSKLSEGYYDIICLQEIWTAGDYIKFRDRLKDCYKSCHYFYSKIIGSGCCIFTKLNLKSTLFYRYSANGYPHALHHGDWLGGKGVGLAVLESLDKKYTINVYVTHFIARYRHLQKDDSYHFHRIVQSHEISEFIKLTSANNSCDAIIVSGDFNMDTEMLGLQLLMSNANLLDPLYNRTNRPSEIKSEETMTCDRPDNPYSNKAWQKWYPDGERLDYTFYRSNNNSIKMECNDCFYVLKEIPNKSGLHYSDHVGVETQFKISGAGGKNGNGESTVPSINSDNNNDACYLNRRNIYIRCLESIPTERARVNSSSVQELFFAVILFVSILSGFPTSMLINSTHIEYRLLLGLQGIVCALLFYYSLGIRKSELYTLSNMEQYFNQKLALCDICEDDSHQKLE